MKIPGFEIDTKNMPWLAWVIISIAVLVVSVGICVSLILYGSVQFKTEKAISKMETMQNQIMEYSQELDK